MSSWLVLLSSESDELFKSDPDSDSEVKRTSGSCPFSCLYPASESIFFFKDEKFLRTCLTTVVIVNAPAFDPWLLLYGSAWTLCPAIITRVEWIHHGEEILKISTVFIILRGLLLPLWSSNVSLLTWEGGCTIVRLALWMGLNDSQ